MTELSGRSLASGIVVGAALACANLYVGMKTGVWETGALTASVASFGLISTVARKRAHSPLEDNLSHTVAVAAGGVPAAAGLLGPIPALALLGVQPPLFAVAAFGMVLAAAGVSLAALLRTRWLVQERLPFPTGISTAELINGLHAARDGRRAHARSLFGSLLGSGLFAWLRVGAPRWIPDATALPGRIGGVAASDLTLGVAWSPMLLGVGMLVGRRIAISMVAGGLIARVVATPALVNAGWLPDGSYGTVTPLLSWPAVGLLAGATLMGTKELVGSAARDTVRLARRGLAHGTARGGLLLILLAVLTAALLRVVFDVGAGVALLAVAIAVPLSAACARAAGETDVAPIGPSGQLSQAALGVFGAQGSPNIMAGSVTNGFATHTNISLAALKAGTLLNASPRRQLIALLAGVLVGTGVAVPAYLLLLRAHPLGSEALPVPAALAWRTFGEVVSTGGSPTLRWLWFPGGLAVGALLTVRSVARRRFALSALGLGIGVILPASYSVTLLAGAFLGEVLNRKRVMPGAVAAGAIAGESFAALLAAVLTAMGVLAA